MISYPLGPYAPPVDGGIICTSAAGMNAPDEADLDEVVSRLIPAGERPAHLSGHRFG
jgi:hypothetical protein